MTYRLYKRVSTKDQDTKRQEVEFQKFVKNNGIKPREIVKYEDKASGKNTEREGFKKLMKDVQKGDVVVVSEMSRLARNLRDLNKTITKIQDKGATVKFLKSPIDGVTFENPSMELMFSNILINLLGYLAEQERLDILERTRQGREVAKKEGRLIGRPKAVSPNGSKKNEYHRIVDLHEKGMNMSEISRQTGVGRSTVYRVLKSLKDA